MTRPLPILVALAVTSPALLAVVRGGLGVDTALLRLLLALVVCGVVDALVRAWWPDPPAPDDGTADPALDSGGVPGVAVGPAGDRRRRLGAGGTTSTSTGGPIHARRQTDVPAP